MALWDPANLGNNISQIVEHDDTQDDAVRSHERGTTAPTTYAVRGQFYAKTDHSTLGEALMYFNSSSTFTLFADPEAAQINASGTIPFAANQAMGGFKLTGLAAGSGAGDSVRYEQVLLLAGGTMTGSIVLSGAATISGFGAPMDMNAKRIENLGAPTADAHAARKQDVDKAAPVAGTFTTTSGSTATVTVTLGWAPSHLIIAMDTASGPADTVMVQAPGTSASETVGGLTSSGRVGVTITRNSTQFTLSFANPSPGNVLNGRYLAWKA